LPAAEGDEVQAMHASELLDGGNERACHVRHRLGGSEALAGMMLEEVGDAAFDLQTGLNDIQIEAVGCESTEISPTFQPTTSGLRVWKVNQNAVIIRQDRCGQATEARSLF
jgi:hypothetical protein